CRGPPPAGAPRPGLLQGPTLTTWQLTFDLRSKPGEDPRWRQAVSLAIDRAGLAAALAGTPATGLVPPATPEWGTGTSGAGGGGAGGGSAGGSAGGGAACRVAWR